VKLEVAVRIPSRLARRIRVQDLLCMRLQFRASELRAKLTVEIVAAASCRNENNAAGGTAVFGFESAVLDLNFLNLRKGDVAVCVEDAAQHVGNFLAVDDERVL